MSGALAIAAVTASLIDRLNNGLLDHDLSHIGSFSVTAKPPDHISTGTTESNQLNLFLYQVTPNLGWRNADLPSRDNGGARITNPPLALDLHYLMTAYGSQDMNAEILLGYAMQLLHQFPGLSRQQLRTVLGNPPPVDGTLLPGPFGTMSAVDLADQVELIKISPMYLSAEELSKLWTAMQARYRPSMAYLVSVVLIQGTGPTRSPLPVLKRGSDDRGPVATAAPFPTLASVRPAASDSLPAMRLSDDLTITGTNLTSQVGATAILENAKAALAQELTTKASTVPGALAVHLPSAADPGAIDQWAVGIYVLSLRVSIPNLPNWVTNGVPIALAPTISVDPHAPTAVNVGDTVTITCMPRLLPQQQPNARVLFGSQALTPATVDTPADVSKPTTVTFVVPDVVRGNSYIVRLRVDGVDSLPIQLDGSPPKLSFDDAQKVKVS